MRKRNGIIVIVSISIVMPVISINCSGTKTKSSHKTFEQFKNELKEMSINNILVTKSDLINKMGEPQKVQVVGSDIYLYYPIADGTVQIISHQPYWESGVPGGYRKINEGAKQPQMPQDEALLDWYKNNEGKIPVYSIEEKKKNDLFMTVVVLKEGENVKEFTAKPSITTKACKEPKIVHKLKSEIEDLSKPYKFISDFYGVYIIENQKADILDVVYYNTPTSILDKPGSEGFNRYVEKNRKKAEKRVQKIVSQFKKNYNQVNESFESSVKTAREKAKQYINSQKSDLKRKAQDKWDNYSEKWIDDNSTLITEPVIYINKINLY